MGLATAMTLLARGALVGLCDINGPSLEKSVHALDAEQKRRVFAQPVDITDRSAVKAFLETAKKRFGKLDGIANVAGTGGRKLGNENIWETAPEEFEFIMNLNVRGIFNVLGEGLKPGLFERARKIVHISSMFAMRGYPKGAVFTASKHTAIGMIKSAAIDVGKRGIN
jgi:NAD(P)-dependent dehydrogenase (short-subunit alcohol dehydrogenase family)